MNALRSRWRLALGTLPLWWFLTATAQTVYEPANVRSARRIIADFEQEETRRRVDVTRRERPRSDALGQAPAGLDPRRAGRSRSLQGDPSAPLDRGALRFPQADRFRSRIRDPALGPRFPQADLTPVGPVPLAYVESRSPRQEGEPFVGPRLEHLRREDAADAFDELDRTDGDSARRTLSGRESAAASADQEHEDEAELSAFERQLRIYEDPEVGRGIRQFGYEVFGRPQEILLDVPVGADYVLGSGDSLVVSVWGNVVDQDYSIVVDRAGQVRLPQVGPVVLKGLTLASAEQLLKRRFDRFFKNYQLQIRVGRLRDMSVHVVGRVGLPGRIRVPSVATLFDAVAAAGGVKKDGSLRDIVVRRRGDEERRIDLYDYLLEGDLGVDVSLSAGDVIVVPSVGPRVAVVGRALRPAIYELEGETISLDALLELAGGFARLANREFVQIESVTAGGLELQVADLRSGPAEDVRLGDGDVAVVRKLSPRLANVVYVAGNVALPGRYALTPGMRVSDVLTGDALISAGFWLARLAPDAVDARAVLPEPHLDYALIRRLDPRSGQERRIAFNLGKAILDRDPAENRTLEPQDTIVVFPRDAFTDPDLVFVSGAVYNEGDFRFFEGMTVLDLVRMSGGLRPEAHLSGAVLTRVYPEQDGARYEHISIDIGAVTAGSTVQNLQLQPADSLAIKRLPEFRQPYRVKVEGEVRHPGTYTVIPGERLSDLLRRAGGFTDDAYLPATQFYRESVRELQKQRISESLRRLELETKVAAQRFTADASALGEKADVEVEARRVESLIESIKESPALGRIVLRVRDPEALAGTQDDLELASGDVLVVPRQPQEINVIGAVFNQTALLYQDGLRVRDYLRECGGPTDTADMERAYVIRSDGSADSTDSARENFRWDGERGRYSRGSLMSSRLYPGDTVVIPHDVKPQLSKLGLTKTIAQILFQAALSTGVVVSIL